MRTAIVLLLLINYGTGLLSQGYFDWSELIQKSHDQAVELRLSQAQKSLAEAEQAEPSNVMRYLVAHYIDFFNVFVSGSSTDKENMLRLTKQRLRATELANELSPYNRYNRAQIYLMNAMVRTRFKSYVRAVRDISMAYSLLEENEDRHPDFEPNNVSLGALQAMIGTVPEKYNWGLRLFGLSGTLHDGRALVYEAMQSLLQEGHPISREAIVITSLIDLHLLGDKMQAWDLVREHLEGESRSPLIAFVKANVAHHAGENEAVLEILAAAPSGKDYEKYAFLDYMRGCAMLYNLDRGAEVYLKRFVKLNQSGVYHKDASLKLVWLDHLFNNGKMAEEYRGKGMDSGTVDHTIDAYAQKMLENWDGYQPDLLKARLLFDGGYYERALDVLQPLPILEDEGEKLEMAYRLGRIYFALEQYPQALLEFERAISYKRGSTHHHVAFAHYWCARTYEVMGRIQKARDLYRLCLRIRTDAYEDSLRQKAKTGLERTEVQIR